MQYFTIVSFLFYLTLFFLELVTFVINLSSDSPNETFTVRLDVDADQGFSGSALVLFSR